MKMKLYILAVLVLFIFNLNIVFAAETAQEIAGKGIDDTAKAAQLQAGDPAKTVGAAIGVLLSVLGIVLVIIVVYGGMLWMTAGGDETQVKKAKTMIIESIVGLAVTLSAYAITDYVVRRVTEATIP